MISSLTPVRKILWHIIFLNGSIENEDSENED